MIAEIDRWVVRDAIRILAEDQRSDTTYTINLSGVSVGDPELLGMIEHEIADTAVDPGRLIFEFTETAAIKDLGASREFTDATGPDRLRLSAGRLRLGLRLLLLPQAPTRQVRQDRRRLRPRLPGSNDDRVLVKAIVDVARGLHKQTIAEFVSSDEALELLREYGVDYAQGFHLGTPEPLLAVGGGRVP